MSYRKMACECNHENRREIHSLAGLHDKQQQITDIFFCFFSPLPELPQLSAGTINHKSPNFKVTLYIA